MNKKAQGIFGRPAYSGPGTLPIGGTTKPQQEAPAPKPEAPKVNTGQLYQAFGTALQTYATLYQQWSAVKSKFDQLYDAATDVYKGLESRVDPGTLINPAKYSSLRSMVVSDPQKVYAYYAKMWQPQKAASNRERILRLAEDVRMVEKFARGWHSEKEKKIKDFQQYMMPELAQQAELVKNYHERLNDILGKLKVPGEALAKANQGASQPESTNQDDGGTQE